MPRKKKSTFTPSWDALELTTYKNFPALTRVLGYPSPPAGDSKTKFLRDLEARFEYERDGNAYVIKARRDKVIEKPKRGNNSKYIEPLSRALYAYAVVNKNYAIPGKQYTFHKSRADWQFVLGMTTNDYRTFMSSRYHDRIVEQYLKKSTSKNAHENIHLFEAETEQKLYDIFSRFLNSAKRQGEINYKKQYWIVSKEYGEQKAGKLETEIIKATRAELLNTYREKLIKQAKKKNPFLDEADLRAKYEPMTVFKLGRARRDFLKEFPVAVNKKMDEGADEEQEKWSFYKAIDITVNNLPEKKPDDLTLYEQILRDQQEENKQLIKSALLEALPERYKRKLEKADKEYAEETKKWIQGSVPNNIVYRPAEDYVEEQEKLIQKYWGKGVNVSTVY